MTMVDPTENVEGSTGALNELRLRRLIDVARTLVAEHELAAVLDQLLEVACDLTGARYAALGVMDEKREQLADFITRGIDPTDARTIGDLPRGRGVLGQLISNPCPLRLDDVGAHPLSYGFPPGHPPMHTFLGVPILIRGEAWGNIYLTEKADGVPFTETDEETAVVLADWAAIAIDNARLYEVNESRRRDLEQSVVALEATTDIARALAGETDVARVLELITKRSRALIGARSLAMLLVDHDDLIIAAVAGELDVALVNQRIPAQGTTAGALLTSLRPQRVDDLSDAISFGLSKLGVVATSGLFVPVVLRGRPLGVIEGFDRLDGQRFSAEDERRLVGAAASAATALSTAQSYADERLARSVEATEEERRRWARELHDETLQGLAALRVLLSTARRSGDPEILARAVDDAIDHVSDEVDGLRALISDLRPATLDDLGVQPAVEALVERVAITTGLEIELTIDLSSARERHGARLTTEIETAVYRIIQEALTNVTKHAKAASARVSIREQDEFISIEVADDGSGFDAHAPTAGVGLIGIQERVQLVGGAFELRNEDDGGVALRVSLPAVHRAQREAV
jgi:signal transduction histidine kinase